MSDPVTIVLVSAEADSATTAILRELLPERVPSGAFGPARCARLHGLDPERLGARLREERADLAILALNPESETLDEPSLRAVRIACLECPVLVVAPAWTPAEFLTLLQAGATDFVVTPIRAADLLPRVVRLAQSRQPRLPAAGLLDRVRGSCQILGQSPGLLALLDRLPRIAGCDVNVLILGETGTGKDLFARAIHYLSDRSAGPFVAVNCGAIPAELVENEPFGHEAGAYTTAVKAQNGLLREAGGGSLFLDEIDTLTLLLTQPWPGNVRELENVIQRAVVLCETATIGHQHLGLPGRPRESGATSFKQLKARAVSQFERQYLIELLHEHDGNISAAARAAGKNRRAFQELLRKHQLLPSPFPAGTATDPSSHAARSSPEAPRANAARPPFRGRASPVDPGL